MVNTFLEASKQRLDHHNACSLFILNGERFYFHFVTKIKLIKQKFS